MEQLLPCVLKKSIEKKENNMQVNDCHYDKLKLMYEFCKIRHFITMHAKNDAKKAIDEKFHTLLEHIEKEVEKFTDQLNQMICK